MRQYLPSRSATGKTVVASISQRTYGWPPLRFFTISGRRNEMERKGHRHRRIAAVPAEQIRAGFSQPRRRAGRAAVGDVADAARRGGGIGARGIQETFG